jgi:tetratricopeptide (TPR) repeat protein
MVGYFDELASAGETAARAESIYHRNRLDWEAGVRAWLDAFDEALRRTADYELCRFLLAVRPELSIDDDQWRGHIATEAGNYFQTVSGYDVALREYSDAIATYEAALARAPNDIFAQRHKARALSAWGRAAVGSQSPEGACPLLEAARVACQLALQLDPGLVEMTKLLEDVQGLLQAHCSQVH